MENENTSSSLKRHMFFRMNLVCYAAKLSTQNFTPFLPKIHVHAQGPQVLMMDRVVLNCCFCVYGWNFLQMSNEENYYENNLHLYLYPKIKKLYIQLLYQQVGPEWPLYLMVNHSKHSLIQRVMELETAPITLSDKGHAGLICFIWGGVPLNRKKHGTLATNQSTWKNPKDKQWAFKHY